MQVESNAHVLTRFQEKVLAPSQYGCWLWAGGLTHDGYGQFHVLKLDGVWTAVHAHRMAWLLRFGSLADALLVCHNCDRWYATADRTYRRCVNTEHLFLGTAKDNSKDMYAKGRDVHHPAFGDRNSTRRYPEIVRGERNGRAKLTYAQIADIRERYAIGGIQYRKLADEFGVTRGMIGHIVRKSNWRS